MDIPTIVTSDYQHPKPSRQVNLKQYDDDSRGDARFLKYADALRKSDLAVCKQLREDWAHELEITTKFDTLERMWFSEMGHYIKEIQIVRRECAGYKKLTEGYLKRLEHDPSAPNADTLIRQGKEILTQVEKARLKHVKVSVPLIFKVIK